MGNWPGRSLALWVRVVDDGGSSAVGEEGICSVGNIQSFISKLIPQIGCIDRTLPCSIDVLSSGETEVGNVSLLVGVLKNDLQSSVKGPMVKGEKETKYSGFKRL